MPSGSIRVGGVRVDFAAQDAQYQAGMSRILTSNARLNTSVIGVGRSHQRQSKLVQQFTSSLRASIIATAAYAAGINLLRNATFGSARAFIEWDAGLVRVAKTTGLTDIELEKLEGRLQNILTGITRTGAPLPISERELLDIAEAAGQIGVQGVENLDRLIQNAAALSVSSDLIGRDAAITLGRLIRVTGAGEESIDDFASAITALGNEIAGSESEIAKFVLSIAQAAGGTGGLSPDVLFALSAAFVETGANAESASTVIGRVLDRVNALADGNVELFNEIGRLSGRTVEQVTELREALRGGDERAYSEALNLIVTALSNLSNIGDETTLSRAGLLEAIFGNTNVRIRQNTSLIANALERVTELTVISAQAIDDQNSQFIEAGRAGAAYEAIIGAVGREINRQRRAFGEFAITSIFGDERDVQSQLRAIERFRQIEINSATVAAGVLANIAIRTARTRYNAFQDSSILRRRALQLEVESTRANVAASNTELVALQARSKVRTTLDVQAAAAKERLNLLRGTEIALESRLSAHTKSRIAEEAALGQTAVLARTLEQRARRNLLEGRVELNRASNQIAAAGTARLAIAKQLALAQVRNVGLVNLEAAAVANLAFVTRAAARAARVARAAYAFVGGGLGLITLALTAGVTAWSLWGKAAIDATSGLEPIEDRLQRIVTDAQNAAKGLTPDNLVIREAKRELFLLSFELQRLRSEEERLGEITERLEGQTDGFLNLASGGRLAAAQSTYLGIANSIEVAEKRLSALGNLLREADAVVSKSAENIADNLSSIGGFVEIDLRIGDPTREIQKFISQTERETAAAFERLDIELQQVTSSQFDRDVALEVFDRRIEAAEKLADLQRQVDDASEDQARAKANVEIADAIAMRLPLETELRKQADAQLESAMSAEETTARALQDAQAIFNAAEGTLNVNEATVRALFKQENILKVNEAVYGEIAQQAPDIFGQTESANAFIQSLVDRVSAQEREADTLQRLEGLRGRERASLEAQIELQSIYAQEVERAGRAIVSAKVRAENAEIQYLEVLMQLPEEASDAQISLVSSLRATADQTARNTIETEAYRNELINTGISIDELASKSGEAAGTIASLSAEAVDYLVFVTELAQSGVRGVEDLIVGVLGGAQFTFRKFAGALIEDLGRIIIRATITANILRALGIGAEGQFTGGGLFGAIGIGAAPAAHSGGIANSLFQIRSGPLRSNERIIVVEKDEEIITRGDPRHRFNLPRYHSGGLGGRGGDGPILGEVDIMVSLENRSSTPLRATQTTQRIDGRRHIVGVVLEDLRDNGPIAQALGSGGGF